VNRWEAEIGDFVTQNADLPRKDFALKTKDAVPARLQSVAFRALDGTPARVGLMEILERASGSDTKVEAIRTLFGMTWKPMATEE